MSNLNLQAQIEEIAKSLMNDKIVMDFCKNEALEKVASEIRAKRGGGTTAKGAELLSYRHPNIQKRIDQYTATALSLCVMMKIEMLHG